MTPNPKGFTASETGRASRWFDEAIAEAESNCETSTFLAWLERGRAFVVEGRALCDVWDEHPYPCMLQLGHEGAHSFSAVGATTRRAEKPAPAAAPTAPKEEE